MSNADKIYVQFNLNLYLAFGDILQSVMENHNLERAHNAGKKLKGAVSIQNHCHGILESTV